MIGYWGNVSMRLCVEIEIFKFDLIFRFETFSNYCKLY